MKSGITILKGLVDTTVRKEPLRNMDDLGNTVGYHVSRGDIERAFVINGYNLYRDTWKQIVQNWIDCKLLIRGDEGFYVSRQTLELFNYAGKYKKMSEEVCQLEALDVKCTVIA